MATPTPTPTATPTAFDIYKAKLNALMGPQATATPTPMANYGSPAPQQGGGGPIGAGLSVGLALAAKKGISSLLASGGGGGAGSIVAPVTTPTMLAPELTPILPSGVAPTALGTQAATQSLAAAGQPSGVLSGTSGLGYWGGPAAFIASAPIWAPKVAKGGDALMKLAGWKNDHPDRKFNLQEALQSKIIPRQAQGASDLSAVINKAHEIGALGLPGYADAQGNTVKGIGQEFIKPRWFTSDDFIAAKQAGKRIEPRAMKITDWKMPGSLTDKARAQWTSLVDMLSAPSVPARNTAPAPTSAATIAALFPPRSKTSSPGVSLKKGKK